jgi:hypothetical protein
VVKSPGFGIWSSNCGRACRDRCARRKAGAYPGFAACYRPHIRQQPDLDFAGRGFGVGAAISRQLLALSFQPSTRLSGSSASSVGPLGNNFSTHLLERWGDDRFPIDTMRHEEPDLSSAPLQLSIYPPARSRCARYLQFCSC